jgi:hypothetical protein
MIKSTRYLSLLLCLLALGAVACASEPDDRADGDEARGTLRQAQTKQQVPIRAAPGCRSECEDLVGVPCIKDCHQNGNTAACGQNCVDKNNSCIDTCNVLQNWTPPSSAPPSEPEPPALPDPGGSGGILRP